MFTGLNDCCALAKCGGGFLFAKNPPNFVSMEKEILKALAGTSRTKTGAKQAANLALILKECAEHGVTMPEQIAYIVGTAWHESRLLCIAEFRAKPGTKVWAMQDRYWGTGFYGRGFVQLTWQRNYKKFGDMLCIDLVSDPDKVLQPEIGAKILVMGMRDGLFTGVGLGKYFKEGQPPEWLNARKIVNGLFHADYVARAAVTVFNVLKSGTDIAPETDLASDVTS